MDTCIICGIPAEESICSTHAEDVFFKFGGNSSEQLTIGRYYQGVVEGIADFGVFVKLNGKVTGLLHRNELKQRLESLGWEIGDVVYVKVKGIQDKGKIDLGWSIRQDENEFRGALVDGGDGTESKNGSGQDETSSWEVKTERKSGSGVPIGMLEKEIGNNIKMKGKVSDIRQTTGPTLFEIQDESGKIICSAFESPGKRVYPDIKVGEVVQIEGKVELRRGSIQVESDVIRPLSGENADAILEKISLVVYEKARPDKFESIEEGLVDYASAERAATEIRMAILESIPIIIRHPATVDGHIAGATIEHSIIRQVEEEYGQIQAIHRHVDRRPYQSNGQEMNAAILDTSRMLESQLRYSDPVPLYIFISDSEDSERYEGMKLIGIYGANRIIIGGGGIGEGEEENYAEIVIKSIEQGGEKTLTALSAEVAVAVDPGRRNELIHLPAISYWKNAPDTYMELAKEAGYELDMIGKIHRAIAVEAFYQRNSSKREMISDMLFGENTELIEQCNSYFVESMEKGILTASPHLDRLVVNGKEIATIDLDKFTHRYQFPATKFLLLGLIEKEQVAAVVGSDTTSIYVEAGGIIDLKELGDDIKSIAAKNGSIDIGGISSGKISFVSGDREEILDAVVESIVKQL